MSMERTSSSSIYNSIIKLTPPYPDFIYNTCLHVDTAGQSMMYEFYLNHPKDVHPRHCLELCTQYQQKYALLNSKKCLCTSIQIKTVEFDKPSFHDTNCRENCQGNHFYSCGNISNSSIYSVYSMQKKCPFGKKTNISTIDHFKENMKH